jgi:hypothetical protein
MVMLSRFLYRHQAGLALNLAIFLSLMVGIAVPNSGYADAFDEPMEDLPEYIVPKTQDPQKKTGKSKKTSFWKRLITGAPKDGPPVSDEAITQVGPRSTVPTVMPLLRLPRSVLLQNNWLPPGIYSVQVAGPPQGTRVITLFQQNKPKGQFEVIEVGTDTGPVESIDPKKPLITINAVMTRDGLKVILMEGQKRYESDTLTTNND